MKAIQVKNIEGTLPPARVSKCNAMLMIFSIIDKTKDT